MCATRWKLLFTAAAFVGAVGLAAPPALAVHDLGLFELEGNATDAGGTLGDDWNTLDGGGGSAFEFTGMDEDRNGIDDVFQGGGSKDTRDTAAAGSTVGGPKWRHTTAADASPPKDDIVTSAAAAYLCDAAAAGTGFCVLNDLIIYFEVDRFKIDGVAQVGFWLFGNEVVPIGGGIFSDIHVIGDVSFGGGDPGDILILIEFSSGGGTPLVRIWEWVGSGGDGGHGGTLNTVATPLNARCGDVGGDLACAISNTGVLSQSWDYEDDDGNTFIQPFAFIEGGINLTQTLGGITPCVSAFLAETRSSGAPLSETAQLKDFNGGSFPLCGVDASKACVPNPTGMECEDGSSCTMDSDCTATESPFSGFCVDSNPFTDDDGVTAIVKFNVGIINTGFGELFNPVIREDITYLDANMASDNFNDKEECFVTAIDGDDSFNPVFLPDDGTFIELDSNALFSGAEVTSIAANSTLPVEITCDTPRLELANIITAGLNTTDGDDATRLTEQFAMTPQGQMDPDTCPLARVLFQCYPL